MTDMIAGPGQGLPLPQALIPRSLWTTPFTPPTNMLTLSPGGSILIPAGTWIIHTGGPNTISRVHWLDPVSREWRPIFHPALGPVTDTIRSDGFNYRITNESGIALSADVSAGGTGYNSATTTVVPSAGDSQWQAIIGGALGAVTITDGGQNYSIAPLVTVQAPPAPGICATGHAVLTNGVVTGIIWDAVGAGYTYAPPIIITPDPFDPVLLAAAQSGSSMTTSDVIRDAKATVVLTGQGTVTAVLLKSAGIPLATAPTLTITGQGSGATATVEPSPWIAPTVDPTITLQASSGP